jgi:hypothetical protein
MRLDARDVREISQFLARRCAVDGGRPGPGAEAEWERRLHAALDDGTLPKLIRPLAARWPEDANLQSAARLLAPRRAPVVSLVAGSAGVILLGLGAALAAGIGRSTAPSPLQPQSVSEVVAAWVPAPAAPQEPAASLDPVATAAEPAAPLATAAAPAAPVAPARPLQPQSVAQAAGASPCGDTPGDVVGWWHAGAERPGQVGDVVTLSRAVNVRSFYPNEQNRFSLRSEVLCVLDVGTRVRLSRAPVSIPGDAWWVAIAGGDVMQDAVAAL